MKNIAVRLIYGEILALKWSSTRAASEGALPLLAAQTYETDYASLLLCVDELLNGVYRDFAREEFKDAITLNLRAASVLPLKSHRRIRLMIKCLMFCGLYKRAAQRDRLYAQFSKEVAQLVDALR